MEFDLTPYFGKYEQLSEQMDQVFERVRSQHPDCVTCKSECSDCCHAVFDLTLIEALYINHRFNNRFSGEARERIIEKANAADRRVYKLKRKAAKDVQDGQSEAAVLEALAVERVRCPLLNEKNLCDLYDHRPITCRLYGIPTAIGGKGRTCGLSGFQPGEPYPTVNLEEIQNRLFALSAAVVQDMKSKHINMADILMPLSMALLTSMDDDFLGLSTAADGAAQKGDGNE
ncbi:MAG: YkgJ family cysteine cluster protein [Pseudomonadota bacterium]